MRPFIFSFILVPFFCLELHRFASHRKKHLWELPVVTILWINLHGAAILAPMLVFAYAVGETVHLIIQKHLNLSAPPGIGKTKLIRLWIIGALCLIACCVTPYGIDSLIFPFHHLFELKNIVTFTTEWLHPLDPRFDRITTQIVFRILLIIVPVSYIVGVRTIRFPHLMLTILTAGLASMGRRFTAYFVLVNLPIIFYNLRDLASRVHLTGGASNRRAWTSLIIISFLSLLAYKYGMPIGVGGGRFGEPGIGLSSRENAPLIRFLIDNEIKGRIFNPMEMGGKLIFTRWPDEKVFIDGRTPVYGDEFFFDYIRTFHNRRFFEELDRKYNFEYIVTSGPEAWNRRHMERYFWESPEWKLVYQGEDGFVYLRDLPKFKKLIRKKELKNHPVIDEMKLGDMKEKNLLY
jgi:hypothetical protein